MSDSIHIQIADALVIELNDAARDWSGEFTASRKWLPVYLDGDLVDLKVSVVPLVLDLTRLSRRPSYDARYGFAIDFQQQVDVNGTAAMDVLDKLVEDVHGYFAAFSDGDSLATMPNVAITKATREDIYFVDRLETDHVWETVIALEVFRHWKP